jgi:hypothetical protein
MAVAHQKTGKLSGFKVMWQPSCIDHSLTGKIIWFSGHMLAILYRHSITGPVIKWLKQDGV